MLLILMLLLLLMPIVIPYLLTRCACMSDFIAAEELGRSEGFWVSNDDHHVLFCRCGSMRWSDISLRCISCVCSSWAAWLWCSYMACLTTAAGQTWKTWLST